MAEATSDAMLPLIERVGDRLRAARLSAGLSLEDIAEKTRIPLRHLDALERSDYAALPSFTYAAGFVRAFARALGVTSPRTCSAERAHPAPTRSRRSGPSTSH